MSASPATIEHWLDASLAAFQDVADQALGLGPLELVENLTEMPENLAGAFIPLAGELDNAQIGLAGGLVERRRICGALMQMPEEESDGLVTSDIADAMGEIVNIAAGSIKQRLQPQLGSLTMGLPLFINGRVEATDRVETRVARVSIGSLSLVIVIVRARGGR